MAWTTPLTAVANAALTAAQWNASVRDNLNETPTAKATTQGWHFVSTGVNSLAERAIVDSVVETSETTTSTSFVDLATVGPTVTLTTGIRAFVFVNSGIANSTSGISTLASFAITGATTTSAIDNRAAIGDGTAGNGPRSGVSTLIDTNSGSNTFTMKYRVTSNTGTFRMRRMQVMGL